MIMTDKDWQKHVDNLAEGWNRGFDRERGEWRALARKLKGELDQALAQSSGGSGNVATARCESSVQTIVAGDHHVIAGVQSADAKAIQELTDENERLKVRIDEQSATLVGLAMNVRS